MLVATNARKRMNGHEQGEKTVDWSIKNFTKKFCSLVTFWAPSAVESPPEKQGETKRI